jgi:hypothetical protein
MFDCYLLGKSQHDGLGKNEYGGSHACPMAGKIHCACLVVAARAGIITRRLHARGLAAHALCMLSGGDLIELGLCRHDGSDDARDAHTQRHDDDQQSAHEELSNTAAASQQLPGTERHASLPPLALIYGILVAKDCLNYRKT